MYEIEDKAKILYYIKVPDGMMIDVKDTKVIMLRPKNGTSYIISLIVNCLTIHNIRTT